MESNLYQLLSVEEAARQLSIARSHLYRYLQTGALKSVKIGRSRRIAVVDLETFVKELRLRQGILD